MSASKEAKRRINTAIIAAIVIAGGLVAGGIHHAKPAPNNNSTISKSQVLKTDSPAIKALGKLAIGGRASMTNYSRENFGGEWADEGSCDMRDKILARDMVHITDKPHTCEVETGILHDPYTGDTIHFQRGVGTSNAVQIDHVVAIGDAWQTGAQQLPAQIRRQLYNDPLELLAVDGPTNESKSDGDAATWLPPNKSYRCRYVARQIAVKLKYHLWVTPAEHDAMSRILHKCPSQPLPVVTKHS
jgi:hypothetical protein